MRAVSHQLLSLLTVFTFVFGMGTGVFQSHWHQEPLGLLAPYAVSSWFMVGLLRTFHNPENYILRIYRRAFITLAIWLPINNIGQAFGLLVMLGYTLTLRGASTCILSTGWSSRVLMPRGRDFSSWGGLRTYMLSALIHSEHSYSASTAGAITDTLAVRPSWSSRTRDGSPQKSCGHAGYGPNCLTTF